jgi:hypothetical protein
MSQKPQKHTHTQPDSAISSEEKLIQYVNLKLAFMGCPTVAAGGDAALQEMTEALLSHQRETDRLLAKYLPPVDQRIQDFLNEHLRDTGVIPRLPSRTFVLDRPGLARVLSLPPDRNEFVSDIVKSYRVRQGVLHNPQNDRRTTQGVFHVAEGGLPVPADKVAVPKGVFAHLLRHALTPPKKLLRLPFTASQRQQAECFVTLLLRPLVCPAVPGVIPQKTMETRFFVPGNLVGNLDFIESIFGNAGDPFLPENDAGLDAHHWTGHTGCVILAPHLTKLTKRELGLPHHDQATPRQRRDGMCYQAPEELYNNGGAFKITCRTSAGVIVTLIADNYFGYCKKEVKTQISYAANLFGLCEEEHAGGAMVYASYDLGEDFSGNLHVRRLDHSFRDVAEKFGPLMELKPDGYGVDRRHPDIIYVPEDVHFDLHKQTVSWPQGEGRSSIRLLPGRTYVRPSGYKIHMEKPAGNRAWRLVGTVAEGTICHKPCTVSGGGKSEISKPITDAILVGPIFVASFQKDFDRVAELLRRDFANRFRKTAAAAKDSRSILSPERSLGSVIKLLTPSPREYTAAYNEWLSTIPQYIKELVFVVKRFYKPEWGEDWRAHFGVDIINGVPGNELKLENRKLATAYLRVGYDADGAWRVFGLRKDFLPSVKLQTEDDITASVVVPRSTVRHLPGTGREEPVSVKFVQNCEIRLFQRPDDAIHRGYDRQAESDFCQPANFFSNYEPLTPADAQNLIEDSIGFVKYTEPMQQLIRNAAADPAGSFFVCTSNPRLVEGKPSRNPRYLQLRPDLANPRSAYLAQVATRLHRRIPLDQPVPTPVSAVLPGRRNNGPDPSAGIRSLAVYNPIHYMELPELFMEFICSITGKSPSTTGAGSEGALTKGPFNALPQIYDLNAALISNILCGFDGFVTSAGCVGPDVRVEHDISMLIPEVWCRMSAAERDPRFLIENGYLERCRDLDYEGRRLPFSRLGYRITGRFAQSFFGRVFNHPHLVFDEFMLRPELQSASVFADGIDNIVSTQQRVASLYFEDGSIELAIPPLRALLHIMKEGHHEGTRLESPEFRSLFTPASVLASDWYRQRLRAKQQLDQTLWQRHVKYLELFLSRETHREEAARLGIAMRLKEAHHQLRGSALPEYVEKLHGTLGVEPTLA